MKKIIGLTGQTGAGKSSTRQVCEELGFYVLDCDAVSRSVTSAGSDALSALCKAFSDDILTEKGELDRAVLAKLAFRDKSSTEKLNKTILPFIVRQILKEIEQCQKPKVILDAPTLFESGLDSICFDTIAVLADEDIRLARIIERDNLTEQAALMRIKAGKADEFYKQNAGHTIYNNANRSEFLSHFRNLLLNISGGN